MAENEWEAKIEKSLKLLQAQINSLQVALQRNLRGQTHPSALSILKSQLGDLLGTTNRVVVTNGDKCVVKKSNVTLSLPQDIHTGATPTFAGLIPNTDKDDLGTALKRWDIFGYDIGVYGTLDWSSNPSKPKIYSQATEPDIPNNTVAFWRDTSVSITYLLFDLAGTQYKVSMPSTGVFGGYAINAVTDVIVSPLASSTYYFGAKAGLEPQTTAIMAPIYITAPGTITAAYIHWLDNAFGGGVAGSNENVSVYVRLNNTTDTLIGTIGSVSSTKLFSNTGLSIAVVQGDYIEIKVVTPAWATPPVDLALGGEIYIKGA